MLISLCLRIERAGPGVASYSTSRASKSHGIVVELYLPFVPNYRLKSALIALKADDESGLHIVTVKAGATVKLSGAVQRSGLVDVIADGEPLSMFVRDLEERAERIEGRRA